MSTEKNFESFLGKSIIKFKDEYSFLGGFRLNEDLHTIIMEDFVFFGKNFNNLHLYVNEKKNIQSVIFGFPTIMDTSFYEAMVNKYGKPSEMTKMDQITHYSKSNKSRNGITSQEINYTLKDCSFEENPLFIIWNKNGFRMKVTLKQKQQLTEVTFSGLNK